MLSDKMLSTISTSRRLLRFRWWLKRKYSSYLWPQQTKQQTFRQQTELNRQRQQWALCVFGIILTVRIIWAFLPAIVLELPLDLKNLPLSVYQFKWNSYWHGEQRYPTVFIIGAMKCGTFALAHFLMHHPQVHVMNEQEYFDKRFLDESFEWYRERQPYTTLDQIVIDKTATYWYASPLRFKTYEEFLQIHHNRSLIYPDLPYPINWKPKSLTDIPELKFIIIVCDPVHRALSHHEMFKYYNWANLDRQQAFSISSEPSIYTVFGKYGHFTAHWLEYFDMSQFLILDGHKFRHDNPAVSLNKVESFLRLKDHFRKEHFEKGKDGRFFCHKSWFGCGPRGKGRFHEPLDPDLAAELTQLYQGDMENFTKLTGMLLPVNSKIR